MSIRTFKKDYEAGKKQETQIKNELANFFNETITPTTNMYEKYDYYSETKVYEIKSRFFNYSRYPTTLLAQDKIFKTQMTQIFIFNFTDGIYYIEYNPKLFRQFPLQPFKRNQRADFNDIEKLYYHIPITNLKKMKQEPENETLEDLEAQLSN